MDVVDAELVGEVGGDVAAVAGEDGQPPDAEAA